MLVGSGDAARIATIGARRMTAKREASLARRVVAEMVGTWLLLAAVVVVPHSE